MTANAGPHIGQSASTLLGTGGVMAELYRDTALRLAPVSRRDAQEMIEELKSKALLHGFRGRAPVDIDALIEAIIAFSTMIRKSGNRFSEKIMLNQNAGATIDSI
jgi:acetate---CoA ligase (ADP-forming)